MGNRSERARQLDGLQRAAPEAPLSDVLEFLWKFDALQVLATLECVVLDPFQRGGQFDALHCALSEGSVVPWKAFSFLGIFVHTKYF